MKHLQRFLLVAVVVGLGACQTQETTSGTDPDAPPVRIASADEARAELQQVNDRWLELQNAADFDALSNMYASDAVVVAPEGTLSGRAAIRRQMEEQHREGVTSSLTTDRIEVADSGDLAYLFGTWSTSDGYAGNYVSVLGRRNGGWVWLTDAYNLTSSPTE